MNRSPLLAFAGGTVVIAVMVLSAFTKMATAAEKPCPRSSTKTTIEQVNPKASSKTNRQNDERATLWWLWTGDVASLTGANLQKPSRGLLLLLLVSRFCQLAPTSTAASTVTASYLLCAQFGSTSSNRVTTSTRRATSGHRPSSSNPAGNLKRNQNWLLWVVMSMIRLWKNLMKLLLKLKNQHNWKARALLGFVDAIC